MDWRASRRIEVRVAPERVREALAWYGRWFPPGGALTVSVLPGVDDFASTLQVEASDALAAATALLEAGALARGLTEASDGFGVELLDDFGSRWLVHEPCPVGLERRREAVREFARGKPVGLVRLWVAAPVGLERHWGRAPGPKEGVLHGALDPSAVLGLPHYEEYDALRTTGEPWWYWSYISSKGHRLMVRSSSFGGFGVIFADPADPELALSLLGFAPEPWSDSRASQGSFWVMRQDDNGNVFVVSTHPSAWEARRDVARLERTGHKQTYWVEETTDA